jgi:hypothetical protein
MYLGLRAGGDDAKAAVAAAPADDTAGSGSGSAVAKNKKKKKGRRGGGGPGLVSGDDPDLGGDDGGDVGTEETEPIVLSAADRKLEWRGEEISLPPRTFDMEDGKESRALDDGEIGAVISRRGSGVIDCLVRAATGTDLSATITLKLAVGGDGKVGKMKMQAPHYLFEQGAYACVKKAASRFDFPATGAGTIVTAPFELSH